MIHSFLKSSSLGNACRRLFVLTLVFSPFLVQAADNSVSTRCSGWQGQGWCLEVPIPGLPEVVTSPAEYISKLYIAAAMIAGILAVGMIVYAGFLWMTSPAIGKIEEAKNRIWSAIIGVILLLASYLILNTINPDLVNLKLGSVDFGNVESKNPLNSGVIGKEPGISGPVGGGAGGGNNATGGGGKVQAGPAGKGYVSLRSLGLPFTGCCTNCRSDKVNEGFVPIAQKLYQACGGTYVVSCAYSPGAGHSNGSRHYVGMALDIEPTRGGYASLRACIQKAGLGGNLHDESRTRVPHFHVSDTGH